VPAAAHVLTPAQFALAWLGTASLQKGPVWWCSHHRHHHRTADTAADAHSPTAHGFWWAHCGWFLLTNRHFAPLSGAVPDLLALPEIVWLERFYLVPPVSLALGLAAVGGGRAAAYGFALATVLCWHATYAINSVAHMQGTRRFACQFNGPCTARNNLCGPITYRAGDTDPHTCAAACSRCSPWARGGTTTTTGTWHRRATASDSRGRSTSPSTPSSVRATARHRCAASYPLRLISNGGCWACMEGEGGTSRAHGGGIQVLNIHRHPSLFSCYT